MSGAHGAAASQHAWRSAIHDKAMLQRRASPIEREPVSAMSLSPEEYREHLQTTSVRAGFSFGDVVLPREGDVRVDGFGLHYLDWGVKGKPPLLFLHGGAVTAHTWDLVCLPLTAD